MLPRVAKHNKSNLVAILSLIRASSSVGNFGEPYSNFSTAWDGMKSQEPKKRPGFRPAS
jgi:hypothetical protein